VSDSIANGECLQCLMKLAIDTKSPTGTVAEAFQVPNAEELSGLLPDYDVIGLLGRGGMGAVYKARQKKLFRMVAIKVLPFQFAKDALLSARFVREGKALAKLHHPQVVTAFDVGEAQGLPYLVMEYVDGTDLASHVRDMGPVGPGQAIQWIIQAAEGFEFAHRKGIIHRDIKPGNLLVDEAGNIKILDLGLARFEQEATGGGGFQDHSLTDAGHFMGSVDFMSPEQAADTRDADARSDIYSLGCTLYFLLTGQRLFREDTVVKTILAHRDQLRPCSRDQRPNIPRDLDAVVRKMVAKSPADRRSSIASKRTAGRWWSKSTKRQQLR
jgi:eukaryotic-like serine/threonine-protein kinase